MSIRTDKVQSMLAKEISAIIRKDLQDPRLGFITVTDVHVSPDFSHATVLISSLEKGEGKALALKALESAAGFIHNLLGKRIRIKRIPQLIFKDDLSIERSARINQLLHEVVDASQSEDTENS